MAVGCQAMTCVFSYAVTGEGCCITLSPGAWDSLNERMRCLSNASDDSSLEVLKVIYRVYSLD